MIFAPQILVRRPPRLVTAAATSTNAWNNSDKGADISLSGSPLLVANLAISSREGVRAVQSTSSNKYYWEVSNDSWDGVNFGPSFGIANSTASLSLGGGSDTNSLVMQWYGGVTISGTDVTTIQTFTTGDVVCIAVDFGASKVWWRTNGGNWNNSGTDNPATSTGGVSMTGNSMAAGPYFAFVQLRGTAQATANFGASAFAQTMPSGFSRWP